MLRILIDEINPKVPKRLGRKTRVCKIEILTSLNLMTGQVGYAVSVDDGGAEVSLGIPYPLEDKLLLLIRALEALKENR